MPAAIRTFNRTRPRAATCTRAQPSRPNASTRAALESAAKKAFRAKVRRQAGDIDLGAVQEHRDYCEQFGVELAGPKLQYVPNNPDRGRYYVVSHQPLPGSTRKYFRYVSPPLSRTVLRILEDWRIARELQDEGRRPLNLGIDFRPLGTAAFLRTLGLAPRGPVRRLASPPAALMREPSPEDDIVIVDKPLINPTVRLASTNVIDLTQPGHTLRVYYYYENDEAPLILELRAPFPNAAIRIEVQILTFSDPWNRTWHSATLGRFILPSYTRGIVLARKGVVVHHGSFRKHHIWAFKGAVPPSPEKESVDVIVIDD
ncbi:hypothetical protein PENSPDRAFT_689393 [Peniophora sp. CONT]|nr:hypothetical protein PENSPDRAFT_689393 [Peniophora sp. CONT]